MITAITLIFVTIGLVYWYIFKWRYTYWERHGIPSAKPQFPFGTLLIGKKLHLGEQILNDYMKLKDKGPIVGGYRLLAPVAYIVDPQLAKDILIRDFHIFYSRGFYENRRDEPLFSHLFALDGARWKKTREKLTPVFSSGKIKYMMPTVRGVAENLVDCLNKELTIDKTVDMKEWVARFTTDVIGTCAFGLECNSLNDPNAEFRKKGRRSLKEAKFFNIFLGSNWPKFARALRLTIFPKDITNFFYSAVKETILYREKNNVRRSDLFDLLIQMWNKQKRNIEEDDHMDGLALEEIAAQAFVFFIAGFESSSNAISLTLLELAQNQELQERARKHINDVLNKHNGELTYEAYMDMTFIEQCVHETLRKYPLAVLFFRKASEDYPIPNTNYVVKKGESVLIPTYAFNHDPDIFPDPEKYDPDRFASKENLNTLGYFPFGDGPRNCIGERFAKLETKLCVINVLKNFRVTPSPKTIYPPQYDNKVLLLTPKAEMYLNIDKV